MKVLMLSQDAKIFEDGSNASVRMASYAGIADAVTIIVFGVGKREEKNLGANVRAVSAGGSNKLDAYFRGWGNIFSEISKNHPDVISAQDPFFIGLAGLVVARLNGIAFQTQLHTDCFSFAYALQSPRQTIETALAFFVILGSDCVRAVSERIAQSVRKFSGTPISVLPIRVQDIPKEAFSKPKEFKNHFTVVSVSRLTEEKRLHLVIDALRELPDVDVIFVGDGPLKQNLELRAKRLGLGDRVSFAGWQNPHPYLANANAFVSVSRFEGYGMALVEAGLHALPIVTTDAGIAGEVFINGEDALVIPGTAEALRGALQKLVSDSGLRASLGASARKKAEGQLVSESMYLSRYAEALRTCTSKTAS